MQKNNIENTISFSFITAIETIILYLLVIIPAEFLLTEKYLVFKWVKPKYKVLVFFGCFIIVFFVNHFMEKIFQTARSFFAPLLLIFLLLLIGNYKYQEFYDYRQKFPRIYSISSDWSIQGMEVTINGKNFGSPIEQGSVFVNDFKMNIEKWTNKEIVFEQPVPDNFFTGELYVEKENNKQTRKIEFTIKDPAEL
jgi:hypothetical protein